MAEMIGPADPPDPDHTLCLTAVVSRLADSLEPVEMVSEPIEAILGPLAEDPSPVWVRLFPV